MERLDKILANARLGSRRQVRDFIKAGRVRVGDAIAKDPSAAFHPEQDAFFLDGEPVDTRKFIYLILNKPDGYLSATEDIKDPVVIDLLSERHRAFSPFPVGRLDKDTTGLLLLTNDGTLNHQLISPRWHVNKVYVARLRDPAQEDYAQRFARGIILEDGYICLPAGFRLLDEEGTTAELTIQEGKFHQVKRMFEALGNQVTALERVRFGPLDLPVDLARGAYRELTSEELDQLMDAVRQKNRPLQLGLGKEQGA